MEDRCIDSRIQEELSRYFGCPENNLSIRLSFDDGKSGDQVFLLTVVSPPNPTQAGEYILKIRKSNTPERFRTEIHNSIVAKSTDNGRIHIPEIINYSSEGDFYLCAVAGNGAGETSSLYSQETEKKRSRFGEFMGLSMFEWSPCTNMKSDHPANLAFEWLGDERLSINSRMAKRLRELIEDELTPAWQLDNRTLPNPFYFFVASARDDSSAFVDNFMRGRQHGDLNQTNILIQSDSTTRQFYLIDFFDYKPETYLFYDQAYLLLDILLDIHGVLLVEWIQFVEDFMNTSTTDLSNSKHSASLTLLNKYSTTFWGEWKRFSSRYPHNSKAMTKQLLCAFASAGLNYINKSLSNKNKQIYALVFSSIAMEMLIRDKTFLEYDHNIDYPILRTADSNVIPEIWNITDGFSALGRYILISSCDPNKINTEAFCSLAPIPWTAIIEINGQLKNDLRSTALSRFRMKQGYSTVLLSKVQESNEPEKESIWCSIILDDIEKNKKLYFNRFIRNRFLNSLSKTLSQQEKYPLVVLVDSDGIDPAIVDFILTDILTVAGDNTPISIIGLSNTDLELEEDTWIKVYKLPCELNEISRNVQLTFKPIETPNVQIPSVNGMIPLDSGIISEIETDMQIIHRRLSSNSADDQGDIFFHGGEPSWYDIAYSRDVERTSYTEEWRGRIEQKLRHASSTSVVRLYHRPGGGGTTMARRIMWDFCSSYPTVLLKKVSDRTSEKMKLLSTASSGMPILVATELPDSSISELRMELIRRNVRALFICVSRCNERIDTRSNSFYLPDTPQMYLATASEDARFLCRRFCERLDPDKDSERINDLQELTYLQNKYGDEIRQPFFYGLFAFGQDYKKLDEYVSRNIDLNNDQELLLLKILSLMSKYSQTLNLNIVEVAHILFLCKPLNASYIAEARLRLSKNCFIVKRNDGYRISHPLIASAILDELIPAGNGLVTLAEQTISTIGRIYSDDSPRLNEIFYELFIYRAPLTDDGQRKVFSDFITDLPNDKQRIHVWNVWKIHTLQIPTTAII